MERLCPEFLAFPFGLALPVGGPAELMLKSLDTFVIKETATDVVFRHADRRIPQFLGNPPVTRT
jgi:hypothetical protein